MRAFIRGFGFAASGVLAAIRAERNLRFDLCAGAYVFLLSLFYDFGRTEYTLLAILVFGVLALELVNTAIERAVDRLGPEKHPLSKAAKDVAAGGVLVFCIGAVVGAVLLFWDTATFAYIGSFFANQPLWLVPLAASLAASYCFVFIYPRKDA